MKTTPARHTHDLTNLLGRPGRRCADYGRHTAATGIWFPASVTTEGSAR